MKKAKIYPKRNRRLCFGAFSLHLFLKPNTGNAFRTKNGAGFTVIELLVVFALIGLLASIVLVTTKGTRERTRIAKLLQFNSSIHHALGAYAFGIWDLDEGTGSTVRDSSGNGHHGMINPMYAPTWTTDTPSGEGYALSFTDFGDYVDLSPSSLLIEHEYNDFTITAWYRSTQSSVVGDEYIFIHWVGVSMGTVIFGPTDDSGHEDRLRLYLRRTSAQTDLTYGTSDIVDQQWHYLVAVRERDRTYIYVDAIKETDQQLTNIGSSSIDITYCVGGTGDCGPFIGNDEPAGHHTDQVYGIIDEVRVYEEALSSAQIQKLYTKGLERHKNLAKRD